MKFYAYGIVHSDGRPWFGGGPCVCQDRQVLKDEVVDPGNAHQPKHDQLKVVGLYFRLRPRRKEKK